MTSSVPAPPETSDVIRRELSRVIASPSFRQSKRCSRLLVHVVEAAIEERWDLLRERSIGVELFHRRTDYGTTDDAVVRVAAGDVRKRLAQYYDCNGVQEGVRIELPAGGYTPVFRWLENKTLVEGQDKVAEILPAPTVAVVVTSLPDPAAASASSSPRPKIGWIVVSVSLAVALAVAGARMLAPSPFQSFWAPALDDKEPILLSLGLIESLTAYVPASEFQQKAKQACTTVESCADFLTQVKPLGVATVPLGDAVGFSQITGFLGRRGKPFRVRGSNSTGYSDINEFDTILIGCFSNRWTVDAMRSLRFRLVSSQHSYILDTQFPDRREWVISRGWPVLQNDVDYAIVARIRDDKTGKVKVIAAGLTPFGTEAAATFIANEKRMNAAFAKLARGWQGRNVELVLRTRVQVSVPGPAEVVASQVW